jgi:5'-3' exonuclease
MKTMKILLVDATPLMVRAFKGPLTAFTNAKGEQTGLRYGFVRCLRSYKERTEADKVVVAYDPAGLFQDRLEFLVEDPGLRSKIEAEAQKVLEMVALTGYASAFMEGHPARDVVGTLAKKFEGDGHDVLVSSTDRDLLSIVGGRVRFWEPAEQRKGRFVGPAEVMQETGRAPGKLEKMFENLERMEFRRGLGDPNLLEALFEKLEFKSLMKHVEELAFG